MSTLAVRGIFFTVFFGSAACAAVIGEAAETAPRSLALVDFAVRAPVEQSEEAGWLGPALAELLQAKLQLFGGARLLERRRVRGLLREATVDAGRMETDPAAGGRVVPVEVLIAGSVSVESENPRRIHVHARAFEFETSKILTEATFAADTDLQGLLAAAEDLAKAFAAGLGLAYTPEQLAYAEPAKLEALRFLVEGEADLAAGLHRAAVAAIQRALEENAGRYFAAAHRLQGEAYQALARASAGEEERQVRAEYLEKFKEDARLASEALFDLGLAYEANGLWRKAIAAFEDYREGLQVVAGEGDWDLNLEEDPALFCRSGGQGSRCRIRIYDHFYDGEGRLCALVRGYRSKAYARDRRESIAVENTWRVAVVEAGRGALEAVHPLPDKIAAEVEGDHRSPFEDTVLKFVGKQGGRVVLAWYRSATDPQTQETTYTSAGVAAFRPGDREPVWLARPGEENVRPADGYVVGDLVIIRCEKRRARELFVLTIDAATGRELSRVSPPGGVSLGGLDLFTGDLHTGQGIYHLRTGHLTAGEKTPAPQPGWPDGSPDYPRPAGRPGVTWVFEAGASERLVIFENGARRLEFAHAELVWNGKNRGQLSPPGTGPLLIRQFIPEDPDRRSRWVLVDVGDWSQTTLYEDYPEATVTNAAALTGRYVLFSLRNLRNGKADNPRYGSPPPGVDEYYNVYDLRTGQFIPFYSFLYEPWFPLSGTNVLAVRGSATFISRTILRRTPLLSKPTVVIPPASEALLRAAESRLRLGEIAGADRDAETFRRESPGDARGYLLLHRVAKAKGDEDRAWSWAVEALNTGQIFPDQARELLAYFQAYRPELERFVFHPVRGRLEFATLPEPGVALMGLGFNMNSPAYLVNLETGAAKAVSLREFHGPPYNGLRFSGREVYGKSDYRASTGQKEWVRKDLITGETAYSDAPFWRDWPAEKGTLFLEKGLAIVTDDADWAEAGKPLVRVIDTASGRELARIETQTAKEQLVRAWTGEEILLLGFAGGDREQFAQGKGGIWYRVESWSIPDGVRRWSHRAEGFLAGNPVFHEGAVTVPIVPGPFPKPGFVPARSPQEHDFRTLLERAVDLELTRLDGVSGEERGRAPVAPTRLSAGSKAVIADHADSCAETRTFGLDDQAYEVIWEPRHKDYAVLRNADFGTLIWHRQGGVDGEPRDDDPVFISIGRGVIAVLRWAGGAGLIGLAGDDTSPSRVKTPEWATKP